MFHLSRLDEGKGLSHLRNKAREYQGLGRSCRRGPGAERRCMCREYRE